jgi:hypothetical protein
MAYFSQEMKQKLAPAINKLCKEYGVKASIAVKHHSQLVVTIRSGEIDFIGNYNSVQSANRWYESDYRQAKDYLQVNQYYISESFSDDASEFLLELNTLMNSLNYDNSDIMTDYFDVGYYTHLTIGTWNKPYQLVNVEELV